MRFRIPDCGLRNGNAVRERDAIFEVACLLCATVACVAQQPQTGTTQSAVGNRQSAIRNPPSADGVSLRTSVSKTRVTIGDPIRYTLTVEADPGVNIVLPNLGANLGAFEIRDYDVHRSKVGKRQRWTAVFTVATYDTGKFKIPSVEILYEANGKVGSLTSQPVEISVESVKPGDQADIKDIKPPATVKLTLWDFRWLIATVVVVIAVVTGLWLILRRRSSGTMEPFAFVEPPVPPDREALHALNELERSGLLEEGKVKEFYTRLSEIVRRYIERQFEIPALESTTREVMANMGHSNFDEDEVALVESLLNTSDLAKFAKLIPPKESGLKGIEQVRHIVVDSAARVGVDANPPATHDAIPEPASEREGDLVDALG